jgi:hypothetical protein
MTTKNDSQAPVNSDSSKPAKLSLRRETVRALGVKSGVQTGVLLGGCGDSCSIWTDNTRTHCINGTKA